jgi:sugar/nucleoside kinase (ribokinase family)
MTSIHWDVLGLGENSVDEVYRLPGAPAANAKMRVIDRRVSPGGQIATALCACARFGLRTGYIGTFGDDENGRLVRRTLEEYGVDTGHALRRAAANRHAVILLDGATGERTVLWQRDPGLALRIDDVPAELIAGARLLHVDNVDEDAAIAAARIARAAGAHVTTDIDQVSDLTPALVAAATFPILAEHVPAALTGESDPERALRALRRNHDGMLCVTLGPRGAMLLDGERLHHVPAFQVAVVDSTGAGDVFRAALIYALLRGDDPPAMLRFANAAAAISCTREGAIGGAPALPEVEKLLAEPYRFSSRNPSGGTVSVSE